MTRSTLPLPRRWDEVQDQRLRSLWNYGFTDAEIAVRLERTIDSVASRRQRLGLTGLERAAKRNVILRITVNPALLDALDSQVSKTGGNRASHTISALRQYLGKE